MDTRGNDRKHDKVDPSNSIEHDEWSEEGSSGPRMVETASDLIDYALEWGAQWHETERTWLVFDDRGSMIGEVQARISVHAGLKACLQWP